MCKFTELSDEQKNVLKALEEKMDEEHLWQAVIAFQKVPFYTASGLPFLYQIKNGKKGTLTREILIDRRANSKTLAWSSVRLAFLHALEKNAASDPAERMVHRPKALGDIRGISYIYPLLWRFGIIQVPAEAAVKMSGELLQYSLFDGEGH